MKFRILMLLAFLLCSCQSVNCAGTYEYCRVECAKFDAVPDDGIGIPLCRCVYP